MGYRFQRSESVIEGVKRIASEQLEKALADIQDEKMDRHEAVHQVRKRFKKIRGLIRLVRPAFEKTYQRENARFRDAARDLSSVRDAQSLIEGFDRLVANLPESNANSFAGIRAHLVERRERIAGEQGDVAESLHDLEEFLHSARAGLENWQLKERGFSAIATGFEKAYDGARQAMEMAEIDGAGVEDFHEWRKRVKYHWYHCRLLENLWKPMMKARCAEAKHLAELLGEDHDYALLDQLLIESPQDFPDQAEREAFCKVIGDAQESIRRESFPMGQRLFAGKSKFLSRQFESWWTAWRSPA